MKYRFKTKEEHIKSFNGIHSSWNVEGEMDYLFGMKVTKAFYDSVVNGNSNAFDSWYIDPGVLTKDNTKIVGYKLIKPEYIIVAEIIMKVNFPSDNYKVTNDSCIHRLKEAGVLDLWFEPIYEAVPVKRAVPTFKLGDITLSHNNGDYFDTDSDKEVRFNDIKYIIDELGCIEDNSLLGYSVVIRDFYLDEMKVLVSEIEAIADYINDIE